MGNGHGYSYAGEAGSAVGRKGGGLDGKEEGSGPPTSGPLISDTCIPIEEHHVSLQWLGALSFYPGAFTPNWRIVSTKGNFYTFNMPFWPQMMIQVFSLSGVGLRGEAAEAPSTMNYPLT